MSWVDVGLRALWKRSEAMGFAPTVVCWIAWLACGATGARAGALALSEHPVLAEVFVLVMAVVEGISGLVAFWIVADHYNYWKRGYRLTWLSGNKWAYEERQADGSAQRLLLSRTVPTEGYPAPCDVFIPSETSWKTAAPEWAPHRRAEIVQRIAESFGADMGGRVTFKDAA